MLYPLQRKARVSKTLGIIFILVFGALLQSCHTYFECIDCHDAPISTWQSDHDCTICAQSMGASSVAPHHFFLPDAALPSSIHSPVWLSTYLESSSIRPPSRAPPVH